MTTTRKPRGLKARQLLPTDVGVNRPHGHAVTAGTPIPHRRGGKGPARPCRYCGHVGVNMGREDRNHAGPALYSCRDADACGGRIRAANAAAGIVRHPADDLPF